MSKTVVVTGAGSGIGKAIATVAAQRDWRVVVTDIDLDAATAVAAGLDDPAGLGHEATQLDVTDPAQAAMVADDIADRLGLDAWMSNAGISFMVPFLDVSLDNYDLTMDINLKGSSSAVRRPPARWSAPGAAGRSSTRRRWRASRAGCRICPTTSPPSTASSA